MAHRVRVVWPSMSVTVVAEILCVIPRRKRLSFTLPEFRRWLFRDSAGAVSDALIDSTVVISSGLALREYALAGMGANLVS